MRPETKEIEKSLQRALASLETCAELYDPLSSEDRRAALAEARTELDRPQPAEDPH